MASLRPRSDNGLLFFDFRWQGKRFRAQTELPDTPESRKQLQPKLKYLSQAIKRGSFSLEAFFPDLATADAALHAPEKTSPPVALTPIAATATSSPNFGTFAEQWFTEFKVGWRKSYTITVRGTLDKYLLQRFGATATGAVTRAQILEFRSSVAANKGKRAGSKMSPARINTIMLILRQILQEAADRYEFTMPMGRLKPLKIPKSHVAPFTLDESLLLITSVRKDYKQYMTVRIFTGMRSGEIHGLKWKYVDFERRIIMIREAIVGGEEEYTKTDSSQRDIVMSQLVFDAMKAQFAATGKTTYVFCNRAGEPIDTNNFTKRVWYPLLRHLGLALRRPYQTRHTAATLWLAAGETPEWIARQLGHSSTEMLFRVYSRFVPNLTRRDGSAFDRLLTAAATKNGTGAGTDANPKSADAKPDAPCPDAQPPPVTGRPSAA